MPAGAHPLRDFYENVRVCGDLKFASFAQGILALLGFKREVRTAFSPKFSAPLAAKKYVGSQNILKVGE